ncbi:MAG TPA: hypothetical protein VIG99_04745 [Myxococcaceae bacterium]
MNHDIDRRRGWRAGLAVFLCYALTAPTVHAAAAAPGQGPSQPASDFRPM